MKTYLCSFILVPSLCWCFACGDGGGDTVSAGGSSGAGGSGGGSAGKGGGGSGGGGGKGGSSSSGGAAGKGGSPSGGAAGSSSGGSPCPRSCPTIAQLNCPEDPPDCVASCEEDIIVIGAVYSDCVDEYTTALDCAADHPASDWECNSQGVAQIKAEFCAAEVSAYTSCTAL